MSNSPKSTIDTPALLVDLDVMESNIAHIAQLCRAHGVNGRPHFKGHKTLEIAQMQISAGAIGITCAKLGEAEILAANGIRDILIANQIVGPLKVRRLMRLLDTADVIVAVDGVDNVRELAAAALQAGKKLRVVIEVDIGLKRAGTDPARCARASVATAPTSVSGSIGLARWSWKPATSAWCRSSGRAKAVSAIAGMAAIDASDDARSRRINV